LTREAEERDYEGFFRSVEPGLRRAAYLLTGDSSQAHDLVQETLARAWENWPRVSRHPHPDAWCRTVLRNLATSRWRRARLERRHAPVTLARDVGPSAGHLDIVAALRRLPARQAQALVLHDVLGFTAQEVADEIGSPAGTVRAWLTRGREALARDLGEPRPQKVEGGRT
jgi:RNA polymerase sigma-70 factor (ECF subfamily)